MVRAVHTLFLVATPIGNLEDMSPRAVRVLREAKLIAAEDTRQTLKLLNHFDIHTPLTSYHEHNKLTRLDQIMASLQEGDVALVSDAGTPALNDPGYELVLAALERGCQVSPVPGPSAPVAALVASGLPSDAFLYLGYLPRKSSERKTFLAVVADLPYTLVFLETPHRLEAALLDLRTALGNRSIAIARELTKQHEEILRCSLEEALAHFRSHPPRGEFTLVVAGKQTVKEIWDEAQLIAALKASLAAGEPPSHLASQLAVQSGWSRREIYRKITEIQDTAL